MYFAILSKYFARYCSFQCDIWSSLQRSNTENVKVVTNSTGSSCIPSNTSCNYFCNMNMLVYWH